MSGKGLEPQRTTNAIGVPRRFSAGMLLIVVAGYGVLFRAIVLLGGDARLVGLIALFATGVAIGQAVLFGGTRPRDASILSGMVICPLFLLIAFVDERGYGWLPLPPSEVYIDTIPRLISAMVYMALAGIGFGYLVGCAAAGIFFGAEYIKRIGDGMPEVEDSAALVGAHTPRSNLETCWNKARAAAAFLSPFQRGHPVRAARSTLIIVAVLLGLALPFVPAPLSFPARVLTVAVALLLAFLHGGVRLVDWRTGLSLLILGFLVTLGPARMLGGTFVNGQAVTFSESVSSEFGSSWILYLGAATAMSLSMIALCGWLAWCMRTLAPAGLRRRATIVACMVTLTLSVSVAWATVRWIDQHFRVPEQSVIAAIARHGSWTSAQLPWQLRRWKPSSPTVAVLERATDKDFELVSELPQLTNLLVWDSSLSRESLAPLCSLSRLRELGMYETRVAGDGFRHLKRLNSVTWLSLTRTNVRDEDLSHMIALANLTRVNLAGTQVGDEGLRHIGKMTWLLSLTVSDTNVTDHGLPHLTQLTSLSRLHLGQCQVTDKGLEHLSKLSSISNLNLRGTPITDAGLAHLTKLPWLTHLILNDTQISDQGAVHLQKLKNLSWLEVRNTRMTMRGVRAIETAKPRCDVYLE